MRVAERVGRRSTGWKGRGIASRVRRGCGGTPGGSAGGAWRMLCHGALAISPGVTPDLRRMGESTREHFQDIVRGGILSDNGMASFADHLSEEDVEAIKSYIQKRALEDRARQQPVN